MPENTNAAGEPSGSAVAAVAHADIVAFLQDPRSYPERPERVEVIETHCARIFLAGPFAYKVKKPVRLPFLDFTTLAAREAACRREFEVNAPHAPEIYLGLVPLTVEADGRLAMGGRGAPAEWIVHMRRFNQEDLLSALIRNGPLSAALCQKLAALAAAYHRLAPAALGADPERSVAALIRQLADALESEAGGLLPAEPAKAFRGRASTAFLRLLPLLVQRAQAGAVRRCHGDLHLGNIVRIGDKPVPFDAIEFDEEIATIDVYYDLAFLLMDMEVRGDRAGANRVLNLYRGEAPVGGEIEGLATLPLFLALRAAVRAMVALARARQEEGRAQEASAKSAEDYLARALSFLAPPPPLLIAVGGLSGSGKSTLSAALAPQAGAAPGALHLRSDVERKRLFGVPEYEKLDAAHYRPEVSRKVYERLMEVAASALKAGHAVILDAVFARPAEREAAEAVAAAANCPFLGIWLEAPPQVLCERVEARQGDASDAKADVVQLQLTYDTGPMTWQRLEASGGPGDVQAKAEALLRGKLQSPLKNLE